MEIPMLDMLQEQNIYSGSDGKFRFKVVPEKDSMKITAYQEYCLEYCREHGLVLGETELPLTEEGMEQLKTWLGQQKKDACL